MMTIERNKYDDEKLAEIRKSQADPYVQYIIINKELNMGTGKLAAQVGHGVEMFAFRYRDLKERQESGEDISTDEYFELNEYKLLLENTDRWLEESFRKVTLVAKAKEWEKIKEQFRCFVVKDAGLTEVDPGSETVIVLWPMKKSSAPKLLKRLQALK